MPPTSPTPESPDRAMADALARQQPLLRNSICLDCADHRTIVSGRGSIFLLCQSERTPSAFPKYPRQPVGQCPFFQAISQAGDGDGGSLSEDSGVCS
ncbi:MAG: hypothetical protein ACK5OB_04565 [Pirellula sp.]